MLLSVFSFKAFTRSGVQRKSSIIKTLERGCLNKGRQFADYYHELRNLKQGGEMFVIFVGISDMEKIPLYAARITGALPTFSNRSFNADKVRTFCNVQIEPVNGRRWFTVYPPINMSHDALKALSYSAISNFFSQVDQGQGVTVEHYLEDSKPSAKQTEEDLRAEIRKLRRKRNMIESIKKRIDEGESTEKVDIGMIAEEQALLEQLKRLELELE